MYVLHRYLGPSRRGAFLGLYRFFFSSDKFSSDNFLLLSDCGNSLFLAVTHVYFVGKQKHMVCLCDQMLFLVSWIFMSLWITVHQTPSLPQQQLTSPYQCIPVLVVHLCIDLVCRLRPCLVTFLGQCIHWHLRRGRTLLLAKVRMPIGRIGIFLAIFH